jgi:hypothetical protein
MVYHRAENVDAVDSVMLTYSWVCNAVVHKTHLYTACRFYAFGLITSILDVSVRLR